MQFYLKVRWKPQSMEKLSYSATEYFYNKNCPSFQIEKEVSLSSLDDLVLA